MCQYSAHDGLISNWHHAHLSAFATGAPGLIMVEASGVVPEGRISVGCTGIWSDEQAKAFKPIINFAHSQNVKIGIQLAHAGRKGSTMRPWDDHQIAAANEGGWETISASPLAYSKMPVPRALTIPEIHALTRSFVDAALRAVAVSFDVVEIHAAHGYLFHQFYSPLSNERSDEYGGSFENRVRFLLETTKAIRAAIPTDTVLFVRISASDWVEGGWNIIDAVELSKALKELGVDLIDASSAGNSPDQKIKVEPGFQVPFATAIRTEVGIPTSAVGLITTPEQAQHIVESNEADAIFLAREMIRNPRWALSAAEKLGIKIKWPAPLVRGQTS
jgi:2,4-dienoyl-CoA reductase-like NADH-dependent reductase (Old Yellow Enzyme family)